MEYEYKVVPVQNEVGFDFNKKCARMEEQMNQICDHMGEASEEEMNSMMEELGTIQDLLMAHDFYIIDSKVEEIGRIAANGEKMPQKSTYFYPKLTTGLVMNKFMDVK